MATVEETEDLLTSALQGDAEAIRAIAARLNGTPEPSAEQAAAAAARDQVNLLVQAVPFRQENRELLEDPEPQKAIVGWEEEFKRNYPGQSYETRREILQEAIHKAYGTYDQRVILEMQNQRRAARGEPPLEYVIPEEPDEFDREHAEDNASAIDAMRKGRAGIPLSEIRKRAGTNQT